MNGLALPPVAMPPLSCAHGDVSWMSQNWPSAEGSGVTAAAGASASTAPTATRAKRRSSVMGRECTKPGWSGERASGRAEVCFGPEWGQTPIQMPPGPLVKIGRKVAPIQAAIEPWRSDRET